MRRKKVVVTLSVLAVLAAGLWVRNSSLPAGPEGGRPIHLLAHRGVAQTFDLAGVGADTCTAERIHPPATPYLENTLPSLQAAFAAGAAAAEIDVQVTADRQLAVFHDATLECRTDGRGAVAEHTMAQLRRLDLGHGYPADGGASHPFRGKGVGLLPTVPEVFAAFPDKELARMRSVDTRVVLVRGEGDWSAGFDTAADLAGIPEGWAGGVWTNRADVVAPLLERG